MGSASGGAGKRGCGSTPGVSGSGPGDSLTTPSPWPGGGTHTLAPTSAECVYLRVHVCVRTVTADSLAVHPQQAGRVLCLGAEVDTGASPVSALPLLHRILPSFRRTAVYLLKALYLRISSGKFFCTYCLIFLVGFWGGSMEGDVIFFTF